VVNQSPLKISRDRFLEPQTAKPSAVQGQRLCLHPPSCAHVIPPRAHLGFRTAEWGPPTRGSDGAACWPVAAFLRRRNVDLRNAAIAGPRCALKTKQGYNSSTDQGGGKAAAGPAPLKTWRIIVDLMENPGECCPETTAARRR